MKYKLLITILCLSFLFLSLRKENAAISPIAFLNSTFTKNYNISFYAKDSLIAWYKFTNGSLKDLSGKNNHIVFNNTQLTTDRFGKANNAYLFNGNGSYMKVSNSASLNPKRISMMAIVKCNGFYRGSCHGNQVFMKGLNDQTDGIYGLRIIPFQKTCDEPTDVANEKALGFYGNNQFAQINAADRRGIIRTNHWVNIIFTYDAVAAKMYVDGKLKSVNYGSVPFSPNAYGLFIGRAEFESFPYWFNGVIDEIRIYKKALNQAEVVTLNNLKD
jgi:Concanavalin A-like lectin/glucanases superfamily